MLDIRYVRDNQEAVAQAMANRNFPWDAELFASLDEQRREAISAEESLQAERNAASKEIGKLMGAGKKEEAEAAKEQVRKINEKLAEASRAGVKIELVVRGICCLIAGVEGDTENIRVISIVGRFLEHSRIYIFGTGDRRRVYISSADFMTRNTERRVEVAAPLLDKSIADRAVEIFETMLRDNVKAREQDSDGNYYHVQPKEGEPRLNSQIYFYEQAYKAAEQAQHEETEREQNLRERKAPKAEELAQAAAALGAPYTVPTAPNGYSQSAKPIHQVKIRRIRK